MNPNAVFNVLVVTSIPASVVFLLNPKSNFHAPKTNKIPKSSNNIGTISKSCIAMSSPPCQAFPPSP